LREAAKAALVQAVKTAVTESADVERLRKLARVSRHAQRDLASAESTLALAKAALQAAGEAGDTSTIRQTRDKIASIERAITEAKDLLAVTAGPLAAARVAVQQVAVRVVTDCRQRLEDAARTAAAEAHAAVSRKCGRDLEALAKAHAVIASYVESDAGDPQRLIVDPPAAVRAVLTALESE
jgi:hypothetical protein